MLQFWGVWDRADVAGLEELVDWGLWVECLVLLLLVLLYVYLFLLLLLILHDPAIPIDLPPLHRIPNLPIQHINLLVQTIHEHLDKHISTQL